MELYRLPKKHVKLLQLLCDRPLVKIYNQANLYYQNLTTGYTEKFLKINKLQAI